MNVKRRPMASAGAGDGPGLGELVGSGPAMRALRGRVRRLARHAAPVLIHGETGTGKELVARALHRCSDRAGGPFVTVNCGAIPRELLEAELFGSAPGAFTGARRREGLVASAHGGALFLDEVGELPPAAQVVLLRVLETGEVVPVGDARPRRVDFRLVSATHRDLRAMVQHGVFRQDLYHRLAAFTIPVPPLRERLEDLPELARALAGDGRLAPGALDRLRGHRWPGNVRELRNVLARAAIEADGGPIRPGHLHLEDWPEAPDPSPFSPGERPLRLVVAEYVLEVYRRHGFNVRATARALQISPTTVYRHLAALGGPDPTLR